MYVYTKIGKGSMKEHIFFPVRCSLTNSTKALLIALVQRFVDRAASVARGCYALVDKVSIIVGGEKFLERKSQERGRLDGAWINCCILNQQATVKKKMTMMMVKKMTMAMVKKIMMSMVKKMTMTMVRTKLHLCEDM